MAVSFKNVDRVPVEVTGAVDAKGHPVDVDEATFAWELISTNEMDLGTLEVDKIDPKKAIFSAGVTGAEGYVRVVATFANGSTLEGTSELVTLTASEAVSFVITFGTPLPRVDDPVTE